MGIATRLCLVREHFLSRPKLITQLCWQNALKNSIHYADHIFPSSCISYAAMQCQNTLALCCME